MELLPKSGADIQFPQHALLDICHQSWTIETDSRRTSDLLSIILLLYFSKHTYMYFRVRSCRWIRHPESKRPDFTLLLIVLKNTVELITHSKKATW